MTAKPNVTQGMVDILSDGLKRQTRDPHSQHIHCELPEAWYYNERDGSVQFDSYYHPGWGPLFATPSVDGEEPVAFKWNNVLSPAPLFAHFDATLPWKPLYPARKWVK